MAAYLGLMSALALLMGYVEYLIPFNFGIPGIRLGLANTVIMFVLIRDGTRQAFTVSCVRIVLSAFLFGNPSAVIYSFAGTTLSILGMSLLVCTRKFSAVGLSAFGGFLHNTGQLIAAFIVLPGLPLVLYLPVLMITGTLTGTLIGFIILMLLKRLGGFY